MSSEVGNNLLLVSDVLFFNVGIKTMHHAHNCHIFAPQSKNAACAFQLTYKSLPFTLEGS